MTIEYTEVIPSEAPIDLLLLGDPSKAKIHSYLAGSQCFAAKRDELIVGICVAKAIGKKVLEIFNVSVAESSHGQGIGTALLKFALPIMASAGYSRVELGTGTFGYQLTFYQRLGFRLDRIVKNYFLDNYEQAIFESGIQHKDMLRLYLEL